MWFEVAVVALLLLIGQIVAGHFEERTPRWRILGKHALIAIFSWVKLLSRSADGSSANRVK